MSLKLAFSAAKGQFIEAMARNQSVIAEAATGALRDAADQVKRDGRAAIGRAGFSQRWQNALRVNLYPKTGPSIDAAAYVFHNIRYAGIFEHGGPITGSPFLWLPLPSAPQKIGRERITPKLYIQRVGPLHAIKRPGKRPLLAGYVVGTPKAGKRVTIAQLRRGQRDARRASANAAFGGRAGRFQTTSVPLFVGIPSVNIRARFGLSGIFARARGGLGVAYLKHLRDING